MGWLSGGGDEKWSTHHEMNSAWYGSSDTCKSFKGLRHPSEQDQSWEGSLHPKFEEKKYVCPI